MVIKKIYNNNIALHLVNAVQNGEKMETTIMVTQTVQELLKIIQIHFRMHLDEGTLDYQRLLTHVQYFAHRLVASELMESEDDTLYQQVKELYPESYGCIRRISEYFEGKFHVEITKEEQMYLMLHISRVVNRQRAEQQNKE